MAYTLEGFIFRGLGLRGMLVSLVLSTWEAHMPGYAALGNRMLLVVTGMPS